MRPQPRVLEDVQRWLGLSEEVPRDPQHENNKKILDMLYVVLNALDSKAGTLMRFNGLVSATMVLMLNPQLSANLRYKLLFISSFVLAILAEFFCFLIFSVKYRFLRHDGDVAHELTCLANVAETRQRLFWVAWYSTMAATLLLFAGVVLNAA